MELIYWPIRLSSMRGVDEVKGMDGVGEGIVILARNEFHFLRDHENLVQHPSNK